MNLIGRRFKNSRLDMEIFVYEINGKEWFVGKDMIKLLGYSENSKPLRKWGEYGAVVWEENKKKIYVKTLEITGKCFANTSTITVNNNIIFINESGLYQLIFSSTLPKAIEFQKWVYEDVLPSLRKNNSYIDKDNITSEQVKDLQKEILDLTQQRNNFNNMLVNNKRKKQRLKTFLESMFPNVENIYEQFLWNMYHSGTLDSNFMPTDKFIQHNKFKNMFIHITKTNKDIKHDLVLTNEGMAELGRRLYVEEGKIKIKNFTI